MGFSRQDEALTLAGARLKAALLEEFGPRGLTEGDFSFTWLAHERPPRGLGAGAVAPLMTAWAGMRSFYPASVVKIFYMVAVEQALAEGRLIETGAIARAQRDMIGRSSNNATNDLIDRLTGTVSGPELPPAEMAQWVRQRFAIDRHFAAYGWPELAGCTICQKTFDDDRYGTEFLFAGGHSGSNHNRLTSDGTARLLHEIVAGRSVSPAHSAKMMGYLERSIRPEDRAADPLNQVDGFFGEGLPAGSRLWSKCGLTLWTSHAPASWRRHDAAYVELPSGRAFTLVCFTEGRAQAENAALLPFVARFVAERTG